MIINKTIVNIENIFNAYSVRAVVKLVLRTWHFKLIQIPGEYSMLLVSFHLQRHMGNFLIQVYGPCVLLVVLSWVSFWLNREATADRVSLGKYFIATA